MTTRNRRGLAALAAALGLLALPRGAAAQAKPVTAASESSGYVEAVANSTFGNVTSQAYGVEFGYRVWSEAQVYVEAGQVRNAATASLSAAAQSIANALTQLQPAAVSYSVKQPVTYFSGGLRFPLAAGGKAVPYVIAGFGIAQVKKDVTYTLASSDPVGQYVTLGDDLTGTDTSLLLNAGGGVMWMATQRLVVDFQFRVQHVFAEGEGMNIGRVGVGLGVKF